VEDYVVLDKTPKIHLADGRSAPVRSITTATQQHLRLDSRREPLLAGRRVVVVDDVISTGASLSAALDLVRASGGDVVAIAVLVTEG
jgi:adenine phosphoribosyltransferase